MMKALSKSAEINRSHRSGSHRRTRNLTVSETRRASRSRTEAQQELVCPQIADIPGRLTEQLLEMNKTFKKLLKTAKEDESAYPDMLEDVHQTSLETVAELSGLSRIPLVAAVADWLDRDPGEAQSRSYLASTVGLLPGPSPGVLLGAFGILSAREQGARSGLPPSRQVHPQSRISASPRRVVCRRGLNISGGTRTVSQVVGSRRSWKGVHRKCQD